MGHTISDIFDRAEPKAPNGVHPVLYVVMELDRPGAPPSRHRLDGVDRVCFGRGPREVRREGGGDRSRLVLRIDDAVMSSDHGELCWRHGGWQLEDPGSKNGAIIGARKARFSTVPLDTVFQLGHTFFLLTEGSFDDAAPLDVAAEPADALHSLEPRITSFVTDLPRIARSVIPVLITGETGTGKEVVARAVHAQSGRRGALVAVNCGAIPANLVESELFGHRKGAFSGGIADRPGHVRAAEAGTLFLDEIAELPLAAQSALLRTLQQREVVPVGESLPVAVDFRLIAATHRDLLQMVRDGQFREDLYSRLLGVTIELPPLRQRRGDLGLLVHELRRRLPLPPPIGPLLSPSAARALLRYDWPRNIRELERVLAGATTRSDGAMIDLAHLPPEIAELGALDAESRPLPAPAPVVDDPQRASTIAALTKHDGNVTAAAQELGIRREQMHRLIRRYGINAVSFRR